MPNQNDRPSWIRESRDVVVLVNRTQHNYILELPTGRYRLDAGRRMRTTHAITEIHQVKELIDRGDLAVEVV